MPEHHSFDALPYQTDKETYLSLEAWMIGDLRPDLFVVAPSIRDVGERELIRELAQASYSQQGFRDSPRRHFISRTFPRQGSEARYAQFVDEPFDVSEITDGFFGVDVIDLTEWLDANLAAEFTTWRRLTDYVIDHPETDFVFIAYTDDAREADPLVRAIRETCAIGIEVVRLDYPSVESLTASFYSQCPGKYLGLEDYVRERISQLCAHGRRPNHSFIKSCALSSLHEYFQIEEGRLALDTTFDRFERLTPLPARTKIIGF